MGEEENRNKNRKPALMPFLFNLTVFAVAVFERAAAQYVSEHFQYDTDVRSVSVTLFTLLLFTDFKKITLNPLMKKMIFIRINKS